MFTFSFSSLCPLRFQNVMNLDVATYNAKKVAYNVTFQETIAASLDGITPQGVTDIQVTEPAADGARMSTHAGGAVPKCSLQYTLTKFDAQVFAPYYICT